jgi:hypothetical protein
MTQRLVTEDNEPGLSLSCPLPAQEFKIISEISVLQSACNHDCIMPDEHFLALFQAMEPLSVNER